MLADFHAFRVTNDRPYWEGTTASRITPGLADHTELWNYSDDVYQGNTIERLDVATLGRHAPILPGISRLPGVLAARRLADNPKAAFRPVSGLVLAVFLGTMVAALLPAIQATTATPTATALSNVLLDGFTLSPICGNSVNCTGSTPAGYGLGTGSAAQQRIAAEGLPPGPGAVVLAGLHRIGGAQTVPIYSVPGVGGSAGPPQYNSVLQCAGKPGDARAGAHPTSIRTRSCRRPGRRRARSGRRCRSARESRPLGSD